jgi:hypothetical protein
MMCRELRFNTLTTSDLPMGKYERYGVLVLDKTTVGIVGQIFSTFAFTYSVLCNRNSILVKSGNKYFFFLNKVFVFRNSQRTQSMSVTMANLIIFQEIFSVYCEKHTNQINTLCGQNTDFLNVTAGEL